MVYDFSPGRSGEYARNFLGDWKGKLVCDDYGGYKASFALGVTEIGCMTRARRKFYDLHITNKSVLAKLALRYIGALYEVEREVRNLEQAVRRRIRQEKAVPLMGVFHVWMIVQRELVHEGLGISQSLGLQSQTWGCVAPLPGRRHGAYRQQLHRKSDKAMGAWAQKLAIRRFSTQRSTCGCVDELDPFSQAQRARCVCLSEECSYSPAYAAGE